MIKLVIFDGGNTLMRDMPQFAGPMVDWPEVEAMPGVEDALRALHQRYQLAVATNAAASGTAQVRGALARVGLDHYFDVIVTARELGIGKPDPAFFDAVLTAAGVVPHHAVMVGDSYRTDVVGAKLAGLWAVWYNPRAEARAGDTPLAPDAEIGAWDELPDAIADLDRRAAGSA